MKDQHGDENEIRFKIQQHKLEQEEFELYQSQLGDADVDKKIRQ